MSQTQPYGETKYLNYNPDNINTLTDAIGLFEWLAEQNAQRGDNISAAAYRDCARLLEREVEQ